MQEPLQDLSELYELVPKKRYLFQTASCDYWADNYVVNKDLTGTVAYLSIINRTYDGGHVVTSIYSPIEAMSDFEPEHTLESFQQMIDEAMSQKDDAADKFAEELSKRVKVMKSNVTGYQ